MYAQKAVAEQGKDGRRENEKQYERSEVCTSVCRGVR